MAYNKLRFYWWYITRRLGTIKLKIPSIRQWILIVLVLGFVGLPAYIIHLDTKVRGQFEGKRWALPARVYARPLELYPDKLINPDQFESELSSLNYRKLTTPTRPGSYNRLGNIFNVITRDFTFWDGKEPWLPLEIEFSKNKLIDVRHTGSGASLGLVRLDPALIGSIYPSHNEDRVLVQLDNTPPMLVKALLAVEDRNFYSHYGIAPKSIIRALWANFRAGAAVQGGSTLTQQLAKNFFLTKERTLWRKFNEALMALLLEWRYEKDEILEAYLNEIYLGQDGKRSIHGFGLASRFYFEQSLSELRLDQLAMLVALVKGPSFYDPRRRPLRTLKRRNLVMNLMKKRNYITQETAEKAQSQTLGVTDTPSSGITRFPAFLELVRTQLKRDYPEESLTSEGLQIFTTFDPYVQYSSEQALNSRIKKLEKWKNLPPDKLQGAVVVVSVDGAEVLAVVGDRNPSFAGFNRALHANRPVGSLIKPAVYLTALKRPSEYTLSSLLDDSPLEADPDEYSPWQPQNFDKESHGFIPLQTALARSYNLSTARLGLKIGIPNVIKTVRKLGIEGELNTYPSMLLGAVSLSPLEVTQMYHTLANGGFRAQLRSIRAVLTVEGYPLQRFPLDIEQAFESAPVFLINTALQEAVRNGTGKSLYNSLPDTLTIAGKTGTSDDSRDSWFAGFTEDRLAVVWLGMDDNSPIDISGASGALHVWGDIITKIGAKPSKLLKPEDIEYVWIDPDSNLRADSSCIGSIELPFIKGSAPIETAPCVGSAIKKLFNWMKGKDE